MVLLRRDTQRALNMGYLMVLTRAPTEEALSRLRSLPGAPRSLRRAAKPLHDLASTYPSNRVRSLLLVAAGDSVGAPTPRTQIEETLHQLMEMPALEAFRWLTRRYPSLANFEQEVQRRARDGDWPLPETRNQIGAKHRGIMWFGLHVTKVVGGKSGELDAVLSSNVAAALVGNALLPYVREDAISYTEPMLSRRILFLTEQLG